MRTSPESSLMVAVVSSCRHLDDSTQPPKFVRDLDLFSFFSFFFSFLPSFPHPLLRSRTELRIDGYVCTYFFILMRGKLCRSFTYVDEEREETREASSLGHSFPRVSRQESSLTLFLFPRLPALFIK